MRLEYDSGEHHVINWSLFYCYDWLGAVFSAVVSSDGRSINRWGEPGAGSVMLTLGIVTGWQNVCQFVDQPGIKSCCNAPRIQYYSYNLFSTVCTTWRTTALSFDLEGMCKSPIYLSLFFRFICCLSNPFFLIKLNS